MATLVLSSVGQSVGGPLGSFVGARLGALADNAIFGPTKVPGREGGRLKDQAVQSSAYGEMIPILFGKARIAGNIIWSRPIKERSTTTTSSAGGGKGEVRAKSRSPIPATAIR